VRRVALAIVLVACGRENPPMDGEGSTGEETSSTTGSSSVGSSSEDSSSSSGLAESSTSTGDASSSTTGPSCSSFDECREASDCPLPEAQCRDCACVGGIGCVRWGSSGAWGQCLIDGMADVDACEADDALCLPDQTPRPTGATCVFPGCDDACDCPQPPAGFEGQVACGDVANNGGASTECYVSCERGLACPEGWSCAQELYCVQAGLESLDPWSPCDVTSLCPATESGADGICFDLVMGSVCSTEGCVDDDDCFEAPASGMSPPTCADMTGDGMAECFLDCSNGRACPDGMTCELDQICVTP
jgi:hypothetical protein